MSLNRRAFLLTLPAAAVLPHVALAMSPKIYAENGVAVDGSDVVAYFTQGKPVAGHKDITLDWMGATWRFATKENRAAFQADPTAYAPQYGGYCAYAASEGYVAPTAPNAWSIVDGKLYLNYSKGVRRRWLKDTKARIAAADSNWPDILN